MGPMGGTTGPLRSESEMWKPKKRKDRFIVRIVESPHTAYFIQFCTIPGRGKSRCRSFSPDTHPEFCAEMVGLVRELYGPKGEADEEAD